MSVRKMVLVALMVLFCVSSAPRMVAAQRTAPEPAVSKLVKFENKTIDVAKGWDEAMACLVWDQIGASECFRTVEELDAKIEAIKAVRPELFVQCESGLWLWEHRSQMGRLLKFYDRGIWQNLSNWSFSNQTSSFYTGACYSHLADYNGGGGYWYPGNTGAWVYNDYIGDTPGWNDRVSSIYQQ